MKMRILPVLLCAVLLCGCSSMLNRSYSSVTTHVETTATEEDPSVLRAEDYQELVSAILHFVSLGERTGTVRLYQYTGDVEADLRDACNEAAHEDPVGSYALYGISHEYERLVSYYECTFTFSYRHNTADISAIRDISTTVALRENIQSAMLVFSSALTVRTNLTVSEETVDTMVNYFYDSEPALALGRPAVQINSYPEEAVGQHIYEISFSYGKPASEMQLLSSQAVSAADSLIAGLTPDRAGIWAACSRLMENRTITEDGSDSVYDFLVQGTGSEEAAARAMELLLNEMGAEYQYVNGTDESGEAHRWCVVCIDGVWSHLDISREMLTEENFLCSDADMEGMSWNAMIPSCDGLPMEPEEEPEATLPAGVPSLNEGENSSGETDEE